MDIRVQNSTKIACVLFRYTCTYAESEGASLTFATENITILDQAFVNARNG